MIEEEIGERLCTRSLFEDTDGLDTVQYILTLKIIGV